MYIYTHYLFSTKKTVQYTDSKETSITVSTSVQPISITKTLLIVPNKNEWDTPLFTGKLLIKFQNILRNTTQVIIWHRVKIIFSVISSPITLERQKWKSSKKKGILLSSPVNSWYNFKRFYETQLKLSHNIGFVYRRTDRRTDGRTWWNQYTPLQLRCGGYD